MTYENKTRTISAPVKQGGVQISRLRRARGRPQAGPYPYQVDLIPPLGGFGDRVEEEIIQFLERRAGTFDIRGQIANGDAFIRYCFTHRTDAEAFHAQFAAAAEKAILKEVVREREN
ncbi:MAG TPA: hypothetical protein VKC66_26775 [Xanthobacteraceae bacterium]|nr:hypothetical protein [Xanthobacteraceae bacterium]